MKHLHKWALGRPIISVITPHLIAISAPDCLGLLELLRSGAVARVLKEIPSAKHWLPFYQNPKRVERVVQDTFFPKGNPQGPRAVTGMFYDRLRAGQGGNIEETNAQLRSLTPEQRKVWATELEKTFRYVYWEQYRALKAELSGKPLNEGINEDVAFNAPEVVFYLLVWIPCWFEYGVLPEELYAKARQGDRIALDKLLRVDKTLICDPEISQAARRLGLERRQDFTQIFAEAFHGAPKGKLDRQKFNVLLAALIFKITSGIGCPLDSMGIRNLFDAAAKDRTDDSYAIETELPESPEAFRKAIYRARPFWTFISEEDKFPSDLCPADFGLRALVSDVDESTPRPTWTEEAPEPAAEPTGRRGLVVHPIQWTVGLFHRIFGRQSK